nr:uncharacterized protein LOC117836503 isoform X2 [Setaria viridis]
MLASPHSCLPHSNRRCSQVNLPPPSPQFVFREEELREGARSLDGYRGLMMATQGTEYLWGKGKADVLLPSLSDQMLKWIIGIMKGYLRLASGGSSRAARFSKTWDLR